MDVLQRPETLKAPTAEAPDTPQPDFIAGGNGRSKAGLQQPAFGKIRLVAPHFDWIIVDSSPVLTSLGCG